MSYRKNNRRPNNLNDPTQVEFEGMNDDKQGLLTEVKIDDDGDVDVFDT